MTTGVEKAAAGNDSRLIEECVRSSLVSLRQMLGGGALAVEAQEFIHSSRRAQRCLQHLRRNGIEVVLTLSGRLCGTFSLVLSNNAARRLVTILVGEVPDADTFSDMACSALKETGNIVASAFLGAVESSSGSGGIPGLPDLRLETDGPDNGGKGQDFELYALPVSLVNGQECCNGTNAGIFIALKH